MHKMENLKEDVVDRRRDEETRNEEKRARA